VSASHRRGDDRDAPRLALSGSSALAQPGTWRRRRWRPLRTGRPP